MLSGIRPIDNPYISIQIQANEFSDSNIEGKSELIDLIKAYTKPHRDLRLEFIKPINLKYTSGYLIRYTYDINQIIKSESLDDILYLPIKVMFDYYFFSPVFSSKCRDKRVFLVEIMYVEFKEIFCDSENLKNRNIIYKLNSYYKNINKDIKERYSEAGEIINTFRFDNI